MNRLSRRWQGLVDFLFPEESDRWLAFLRIGLGFLVICYALSLLGDWHYLFATKGTAIVTRDFAEALLSLQTRLLPRLGWLVAIGSGVGLGEGTILSLAWACLFAAGIGLLLGIFSRYFAVLAWFLHLCAARSGTFVTYGVDDFITIGLFYLMLSPLPDRYSVDGRLRKLAPKGPQALGFFRRVLQLHLSLIYFFSGLAKCLGSGWWDGSNLWRALTRPPFCVIPAEILVRCQWIFPIAGIAICIIELGYPIFIWVSKTRLLWFVAVVGMHAAIGVMMGMYLFASIMIVLNLAAFGSDLFVFRQKRPAESRVPVPSTID